MALANHLEEVEIPCSDCGQRKASFNFKVTDQEVDENGIILGCEESILSNCVEHVLNNENKMKQHFLQKYIFFLETYILSMKHPSPTLSDDNQPPAKRVKSSLLSDNVKELFQMGWKHHKQKEYDQAIECWTKSGELGNKLALYNLGCLYSQNAYKDYVARDYNKALKYYCQAYELGKIKLTALNVGGIYYHE